MAMLGTLFDVLLLRQCNVLRDLLARLRVQVEALSDGLRDDPRVMLRFEEQLALHAIYQDRQLQTVR